MALFFEDVRPGQRFVTAGKTITRERILSFGQEFDPQPMHVSEAAARRSAFGALVASGWHTAAVMMSLIVTAGGPVFEGAQGMGMDELRWPRPVFPGDNLHVDTEILEARDSRSRTDRGIIRMRSMVLNQDKQVVMSVLHAVLVARRTAKQAEGGGR